MDDTTDPLADEALPRARLALLLEQFSRLDDERESWRVMYPLSEVLLLLTCATIASCDDFGFLATFGDQVPAVWPQSPCRLTSWFRFTAVSPKVAKSPSLARRGSANHSAGIFLGHPCVCFQSAVAPPSSPLAESLSSSCVEARANTATLESRPS